jgi:hypothetical protein
MIKEIDFEKNYAATKMNKRGCYGKSRQNKSVTTMQPGLFSPESKVLRLLPMSQIKTPSGIGRYRQNVTDRNFEILGGRPNRKRL